MTRLGTVLLMHEGSSWTACSLAKTNLLSKKYMGHKKGRYTLIMWVGSFQCCDRSVPSAYFLFLFFLLLPSTLPFYDYYSFWRSYLSYYLWGYNDATGKKKFRFILVIHETRMGRYTFIFFSGVLFCYPLLPWFCWPFPFSPFCSYRFIFITASTHALSSTLLQPPLSPFIIIISLLRSHLSSIFFSFLICFPIMHGTTTIHETC